MANADTLVTLATDLHACLSDGNSWTVFLSALRQATLADHANITFRRRDAAMNDLTSFADGSLPSPALSQWYLAELYRADPFPYHALEPLRPYGLGELIDPSDAAASNFVRDFLQPSGLNHLIIVRANEPGGYNAWLTIGRGDRDFDAADTALMRGLARLMAMLLSSRSAIDRGQRLQASYEAATARLNVGVATLAADGRILGADTTADRMLTSGRSIRRDAHQRLIASQPAAMRALRLALREFVRNPDANPRAISLSEEPRSDMLLIPVTDRPMSGLHTPVLTAYIHADGAPVERIETLMEMFRLTRNEARLALALSRGSTLAEAAIEIGLTIGSARTYSKRIFQKTGTHRQAELVRIILTSTSILG